MPVLTFITADGSRTPVHVEPGANVMRTAIGADIPGIIGECGGAAMCATCHVYVDAANAADFPPVSDLENDMLDCTADQRQETSRLSCQLSMPANDATVHVPAHQI